MERSSPFRSRMPHPRSGSAFTHTRRHRRFSAYSGLEKFTKLHTQNSSSSKLPVAAPRFPTLQVRSREPCVNTLSENSGKILPPRPRPNDEPAGSGIECKLNALPPSCGRDLSFSPFPETGRKIRSVGWCLHLIPHSAVTGGAFTTTQKFFAHSQGFARERESARVFRFSQTIFHTFSKTESESAQLESGRESSRACSRRELVRGSLRKAQVLSFLRKLALRFVVNAARGRSFRVDFCAVAAAKEVDNFVDANFGKADWWRDASRKQRILRTLAVAAAGMERNESYS